MRTTKATCTFLAVLLMLAAFPGSPQTTWQVQRTMQIGGSGEAWTCNEAWLLHDCRCGCPCPKVMTYGISYLGESCLLGDFFCFTRSSGVVRCEC
jgi:hypothetical protein